MNFLGLSVIGAAIVSILLGLAGSHYEKKEELPAAQESQQLEVAEVSASYDMQEE